LLVKDRELAWTCGQVPLDGASQVLKPDDLTGQMELVCDYVERILRLGGMGSDTVGKLVLYFVERNAGDRDAIMACCRARFGDRPLLVPIAVPHFYFDGLLLEVDVFAGSSTGKSIERSSRQSRLKITDGGDLVWAMLRVDPSELRQGAALLNSGLSELGLSPAHRLSEHWIGPRDDDGAKALARTAQALGQIGLISDEGALVESTNPAALLVGEITYAKRSVSAQDIAIDGVNVVARKSGPFAWFSARSLDGNLGLVQQTSCLMAALAETLKGQHLDFGAVVKSTSHYIGGNSTEELLENMKVRNGYYSAPGPASTGLPVSGFADANSRIVVDFLTVHNA
jgi:enamine deaminase RidA (YjgF/YER057c/UK114 family)